MEFIEARDLIRHLDAVFCNEIDGLAMGRKASRKRYCDAIRPILAELIGRKPTANEVLTTSQEI
jgi:hypothetical protein